MTTDPGDLVLDATCGSGTTTYVAEQWGRRWITIDTDYNEESFFVRHAYFLGANDPCSALKTTLKAEIDREAWESLTSDTSRPFPKPKSGRIAVKVINHLSQCQLEMCIQGTLSVSQCASFDPLCAPSVQSKESGKRVKPTSRSTSRR